MRTRAHAFIDRAQNLFGIVLEELPDAVAIHGLNIEVQSMMDMHRSGDAIATFHHIAESCSGASRDYHLPLVDLGNHIAWQAPGAGIVMWYGRKHCCLASGGRAGRRRAKDWRKKAEDTSKSLARRCCDCFQDGVDCRRI